VIATDGTFTKAIHYQLNQTLTLNGEDVNDLFSEEQTLRFIKQPQLIDIEDKVILSRQELIKTFEEIDDLLRKDCFQAGDERFSEFANILFLKIISEVEVKNKNSTVEKKHL
jgi:type I restriction enzyme M protein